MNLRLVCSFWIALEIVVVAAWTVDPRCTALFAAAPSSASSSSRVNEEQQGTFSYPTRKTVQVIPHNGQFRKTRPGEVSVLSFNLLAPYYHCKNEDEHVLRRDRETRLPASMEMAKSFHADVLCLQEVEGGTAELEKNLQALLLHPYDAFFWAPLHPNRDDEVVGLCTAWKTSKYRLVKSESFLRGTIVHLMDASNNSTVSIVNLHLNAKPGAIERRLRAVATTIQRLEHSNRLRIIAGDLNCNADSVTLQYMQNGNVGHGTLKDRAFEIKLTKTRASNLQHNLRFKSVYEKLKTHAPITVSLQNRGPACMDHILFETPKLSTRTRNLGKRQARRRLGAAQQHTNESSSLLSRIHYVDAVLATMDANDPERTNDIRNGLPNLEKGFPSDHLPIGALISYTEREKIAHHHSLSATASKRRQTYRDSVRIRSRHNAIVAAVADWVGAASVTNMIARDQPLYKSKDFALLNGKTRAPDILCEIDGNKVLIEITVVSNHHETARKQKIRKYRDVVNVLSINNTASPICVIVLTESGEIPISTLQDLTQLAMLVGKDDAHEFAQQLAELAMS